MTKKFNGYSPGKRDRKSAVYLPKNISFGEVMKDKMPVLPVEDEYCIILKGSVARAVKTALAGFEVSQIDNVVLSHHAPGYTKMEMSLYLTKADEKKGYNLPLYDPDKCKFPVKLGTIADDVEKFNKSAPTEMRCNRCGKLMDDCACELPKSCLKYRSILCPKRFGTPTKEDCLRCQVKEEKK